MRDRSEVMGREDVPTHLDADEVTRAIEEVEGMSAEYEDDSPLHAGEVEEVEVVEVTAVDVTVRSVESGLEWSMGWDRALDRTDLSDRADVIGEALGGQ